MKTKWWTALQRSYKPFEIDQQQKVCPNICNLQLIRNAQLPGFQQMKNKDRKNEAKSWTALQRSYKTFEIDQQQKDCPNICNLQLIRNAQRPGFQQIYFWSYKLNPKIEWSL